MKFNNLKEVVTHLERINKDNYYLDYIISEGTVSKEWYEAILKKVEKYKPKRVIDIGSNANIFGYLFANKGIEYVGIDIDKTLTPITADDIKFIHSNYYDVRENFKNDIIISCLCVGYLIPIKDVLGKKIIINDMSNGKCIAKEIDLRGVMLKEKSR